MSKQSIVVTDADGVSVGTVAPNLLESLEYISEQSGLSCLTLLEASLALFIACASATLGPKDFLPRRKKT